MILQRCREADGARIIDKANKRSSPLFRDQPADKRRTLAVKNLLPPQRIGVFFQSGQIACRPRLPMLDGVLEIGVVPLLLEEAIEEHGHPFVGPAGGRQPGKMIGQHNMHQFVRQGIGHCLVAVPHHIDLPGDDPFGEKLDARRPADRNRLHTHRCRKRCRG